jgi:hypothetical protein
VFISWSGARAGEIAQELKNWLEVAFQFTKPFLSKEIGAGRRWSQEIAQALELCNFGILILTPENVDSNWLLFEAGALAKHLGESRVVPLLIDMNASELRPPLSEFQGVRLGDELNKLAESLNQAQPDPWPADRLSNAFRWTHQKFVADVGSIVQKARPKVEQPKPLRAADEVLDEILQTVKLLQRNELPEHVEYGGHEQYYPVNDRVLLYKFLKSRVSLPLYKQASMPSLFDAAARFIQKLKPSMDGEKALSIVAKHLVSERPLQDLLDGLSRYEAETKRSPA